MTIERLDTENRLFTLLWQPVMSDFDRVRYLRRFVASIKAELENPVSSRTKSAKAVAFEEALLLSAQKELRKLESRIFLL